MYVGIIIFDITRDACLGDFHGSDRFAKKIGQVAKPDFWWGGPSPIRYLLFHTIWIFCHVDIKYHWSHLLVRKWQNIGWPVGHSQNLSKLSTVFTPSAFVPQTTHRWCVTHTGIVQSIIFTIKTVNCGLKLRQLFSLSSFPHHQHVHYLLPNSHRIEITLTNMMTPKTQWCIPTIPFSRSSSESHTTSSMIHQKSNISL